MTPQQYGATLRRHARVELPATARQFLGDRARAAHAAVVEGSRGFAETGLYAASHTLAPDQPRWAMLPEGDHSPASTAEAAAAIAGLRRGQDVVLANDAGAGTGGSSYAAQVEGEHQVYGRMLSTLSVRVRGLWDAAARRWMR